MLTATPITETTWRVVARNEDGAEVVHTVAMRPDNSTAEAAMAIIAAMSAPELPPTAEALLAAERAGMSCSRMQGVLALGPVIWAQVLAYRDLPQTTWAERIIIDDAALWHRNSQNIAFLGYLCGLTPEQMDALFRSAVMITA